MFRLFNSSKKEKSSNIDETLYEWKFIETEELEQFSNALLDIYEKRYVGLIIKNVFSQEEVQLMKQGVE